MYVVLPLFLPREKQPDEYAQIQAISKIEGFHNNSQDHVTFYNHNKTIFIKIYIKICKICNHKREYSVTYNCHM